MSTKVLLILAFGLSAAVPSAQAASFLGIVRCHAANTGPDRGVRVAINRYFGPPVFGRPVSTSLTALVTETTLAGERQVGQYEVIERQSPAIGAPRSFVGPGFSLELTPDSTPVAGHFRGHVTAEAQGRRVSEDLLCVYVR